MSVDEDKTFYTVTMARVHADQGRYEAAARIYRYLLDRTPDRPDLQSALNDVLTKTARSAGLLGGHCRIGGTVDQPDAAV